MANKTKIIEKVLQEGRINLTEHESKELLKAYQIPVTREIEVSSHEGLMKALHEIGYPVVLKGSSPDLAHKTEQGMVKIDLRSEKEALKAFEEIMSRMEGDVKSVLVQEMVKGIRELMVGLIRDSQFGPCVMFGLGGIFTEILKDTSFRVAPLHKADAMEMLLEIRGHKILEAVRGMPAADVEQLSNILIKVGEIGLENEAVKEIDINPIILSGSRPVAVDALVVLHAPQG